MLALLFAVVLIALTIVALLVVGVIAAIVTGVVLVNVFAAILGIRSRDLHEVHRRRRERWRPSSFRMPPEVTDEPDDEHAKSLTIHRR